jgi:aliphatic sulfonates family ABC transporter substrate-binding protein
VRRAVSSAAWLAVALTVVLSTGPGFTACPARAQSLLPIKIGYQSTPDWLLFVARDLKLFESAGLAPTYVKFVAGAPMIAAARSERIDVATVGSVPFLLGLSQGVDWVLIGIDPEGAYAEGLVARRDSGIRGITDLKGKRVGFFKGSTAHYGIVTALRQHGMRVDQVTLVHLSPAEQLAALAKGQIDAAMVWEPWIQKMIHEANARLVETEGDLGIYMNVDGYAVRRDWLRDNRDAAVRFLRALLMAHDVVQKDARIAIRGLAQEMEIKPAWAEAIYQNAPPPKIHEWANPRYDYSLVTASAFHRRLGYLAQFLRDQELLPREPDVSTVLDPSVIAEALRAHKGGR